MSEDRVMARASEPQTKDGDNIVERAGGARPQIEYAAVGGEVSREFTEQAERLQMRFTKGSGWRETWTNSTTEP